MTGRDKLQIAGLIVGLVGACAWLVGGPLRTAGVAVAVVGGLVLLYGALFVERR